MIVTVQDALVAQRIDRSMRTSQRPKHLTARHRLGDLIGSSPALEKVRRLALIGAAFYLSRSIARHCRRA
jgi:transcriptional regulator, propionate catabolism operon regulatory protein